MIRRIYGMRNARPIQVPIPELVIGFCLAAPVVAGLAGTMLPAFGYLPALGHNSVSVDAFKNLADTPGITRSILLSLGTGLVSTGLSVALVMLFTAAFLGTALFNWIRTLLSPLLAVPHAAAAFGLAFLIAPSGFVMRLLSPWVTGLQRPPDILILNDPLGLAMVLGLIIKEVPFLFLMVLAALPQTKAEELTATASSLGYGRVSGFLKAVAPLVYLRIRLPVLAVLAYSSSVVDVAEILGPTAPAPLAPRIIDWINDPNPALRMKASAGAFVQLFLTGFAIILWLGLERLARKILSNAARSGRRHQSDMIWRYTIAIIIFILTGGMLAGLALLPIWSIAQGWWFPNALPNGLTFHLWHDLGRRTGGPLLSSLIIGLVSTLLCAILIVWHLEVLTRRSREFSTRMAKGHIFNFVLFLPLIVPQVSFLFGLQVLTSYLHVDGMFVTVCLVHMIFVLPYFYLSLKGPWLALDPRYAQLAASLGSSNNRILFKIRLPLLLQPLLVALAVGFAVSIGQYLPTLMIGGGRIVTVTTESVALASGGNRPLTALYGTLQLLLPVFAFGLAGFLPLLAHRNRRHMRVA